MLVKGVKNPGRTVTAIVHTVAISSFVIMLKQNLKYLASCLQRFEGQSPGAWSKLEKCVWLSGCQERMPGISIPGRKSRSTAPKQKLAWQYGKSENVLQLILTFFVCRWMSYKDRWSSYKPSWMKALSTSSRCQYSSVSASLEGTRAQGHLCPL